MQQHQKKRFVSTQIKKIDSLQKRIAAADKARDSIKSVTDRIKEKCTNPATKKQCEKA